ncbi:MAG: ATP-dependent metallopeptidase FtsH/Yme1/Tma family protein [Ruminococcaceae bacterium]|nr:ATP-dependent metallopeptidase FtsH/Yme1/Tma family protein [Oscillospiraceae bacterium]
MALFAVLLILVYALSGTQSASVKKVYSDLIREVESGRVVELTVIENTAVAKLSEPIKITDMNGKVISDKVDKIEVDIPNMLVFEQDLGDTIRAQVREGKLKYDTQAPVSQPWWVSLLPVLGTVGLLIFIYIFFMQNSGGGGKAMSFGKSRAKVSTGANGKKVLFSDVAGADEEKAELEEIVDFLRYPKKYIDLGARIPRGVLLVGPPGTGKTLLAKAVAGEAGVPFFSISGSDFVEMFVGVGASRVRDLFEQAKKNSPCIVFIDEIDAVGRQRGAGLGGGHDEREQTLNQLLVEMDGFGENAGVIILAATNRPDILDPALLRPGRFDRQVVVGVPDVVGREAILKVHSRGKPIGEDVDLSVIAKTTAGFTGADLENLMNEAALLAARENAPKIHIAHLEDAMLKVVMGTEKKSRKITEHEKKLTAYHEAGHAVITKHLPTQDPVHEVSIIPRGMAGGYTMHLPSEDKWYTSKTEMIENIIVLLGGRVAEKISLDDISSGASNDIERATEIARKMVMQYGMSDKLGPINYGGSAHEVFIGRDLAQSKNYSEEVAARIDEEIRDIVDSCYKKCEEILRSDFETLTRVANALIEREKISGAEFEKLFDNIALDDVKSQTENDAQDVQVQTENSENA